MATDYRVTRDLTALPERPSETTEESDYIGAPVSEVLDNAELDESQKKDALRGTKSTSGEAYDPLLHSFPPSETLKGAWKKRRGTKAGTAPTGVSNAEYKQAAQQAAMLYAQLNHFALGEGAEVDSDFLPIVASGFESYYHENGLRRLPSWAQVVVGCAQYTAHVASKEKPKRKVRAWFKKSMRFLGLISGDDDEKSDKAANGE